VIDRKQESQLEANEPLPIRLTRQFYEWERRGRGWQVWEAPVDIEPSFSPFCFHRAPLSSPVDDGHSPPRLSRLLEGLLRLGRGNQIPSQAKTQLDDGQDTPRFVDRDIDAVFEIQLAVPAQLKIGQQTTEQFLRSLPGPLGPFAFEVVGQNEAIHVQMACPRQAGSSVRQQLQAHFPEVVLTQRQGFLDNQWQASSTGHIAVVDFGLSQEFMLPLRVFGSLETDPLTGIYGALSGLETGEIAIFQVLFQPVRNSWETSILRAVQDDQGGSFFADAPHILSQAKSKISSPLFSCVIRLGCLSRDDNRVWELARSLGATLGTFAEGNSNQLIPLDNDSYPDDEHVADLLARTSRRSGMIVNSRELLGLVHPPSPSVQSEKLNRHAKKTRAAPKLSLEHPLILGTNFHASQTREVSLSSQQRMQHMYVIGASGTGKSTLLLQSILQDLENGDGLAVLEPHGDLIDQVLERIPENRLDDVVLVDPADADYPVGLNVLSAHSELEKTLLASDLVAVFKRLSTSWGDQMTSVLGNAILAFLESSRGGTLFDLRRFLVEASFRQEFLTTVTDPEVVYFWQKEFPLLSGKPQAPLLTRLDTFLRPKLIRYMVAQKESRLDFGSIMNDGKILLARLSQGAIGEENAYLLGALLVAKLQQLAMSRQQIAEEKRKPFYLYIDEFHNFVTPSMATILSGARKYRLGLILAHQDLKQLSSRSPEVLSSVLSNPYTRICFRVGDQDARALTEGFASFDAKDLQSLGIGEAIMRMERADYDFNLETQPLSPIDREQGQKRKREAIAGSRARYARPRSEVEQILQKATDRAEDRTEQPEKPPVKTQERLSKKPKKPADESDIRPVSLQEAPEYSPGRGGTQHKYLQSLVKRWAESRGWRAEIEQRVLDGLGSVDVALRKGEQSVACEIGVSSPPEEELKNIQKCLAAGFSQVVHVSSERKVTARVRNLVEENLSEAEQERVRIGLPDDLFALLEQLDAEASEQTVRGYKVKVKYKAVGEKEKSARRQAVSSVIARALKRLKKDR